MNEPTPPGLARNGSSDARGSMMTLMPRDIVHPPERGVLCWGGPEHGRVIPIKGIRDVFLFPVQRRVTRASYLDDLDDPIAPAFGTVRYDVEKFAWVTPDGDYESWRVLVYPENKDTQKRQLEVAANFVIWLATPALLLLGASEQSGDSEVR